MLTRPPFVRVHNSRIGEDPLTNTSMSKALKDCEVYDVSDEESFFQSHKDSNPKLSSPCLMALLENRLAWIPCDREEQDLISFVENPFLEEENIIPMAPGSADLLLKDKSLSSLSSAICHPQERKCVLSVRLMDGAVVKSEFGEDQCLLDVKRWLRSESLIPNTPEDDEIISTYVQIGYPPKFRYAFFYPATRHTFSESEELLRLKDIGLVSRVSLILRPDYDPASRPKEFKEDIKSSWSQTLQRFGNVLQALYQFFDYGVDEAHKEFQDFTESLDHKDYGAPHFLGTAPATGSLVNIASARDTFTKADDGEVARMDYSYVNMVSRASTPSLQITETKTRKED